MIHDIGHFIHVSGRDDLSLSKDIIRSLQILSITDLQSPKLVLKRSSESTLRYHKSKTKAKVKNMAWPFSYCSVVSQTTTTFNLALTMAQEIDFEIGFFRIFRNRTLALTSDDLENHFVVNGKSAFTNITNRFYSRIAFHCERIDVRADGRMEGWTNIFTHIIRSSLQKAKMT